MKQNKDRNAACAAGRMGRTLRRAALLCLICLMALSGPALPGAAGIHGASGQPGLLLLGEAQEGDRVAVTIRLTDAVFNALQLQLRYDPAVLELCDPGTGTGIEGTVEGGDLRQEGSPLVFLEPFYSARMPEGWIDAGTFSAVAAGQAASLAGDGEIRLLLSVNQGTTNEKTVTNDGGGKFIEAKGGGLDLAQIWFHVTGTLGEDSLSLSPSGANTGLSLSIYNPAGGIIGYRDPGLAEVELPGVGTVNQSDGNSYEPEYSGGTGGDEGDIDWEKPGENPPITGGGTGGSGSGTGTGSGSTGTGSGGTTGTTGGQTPGTGTTGGQQTGGGTTNPTGGSSGGTAAFADLQGHWAQASIQALIQKGLISGYPDNTVRPEDTLTRAEFCVVLSKALGYTTTPESGFDDASRHWANGYIGAVHSMGVAKGTGERAFSPDLGITREELVTMIGNAQKWAGSGASASDAVLNFTDTGEISSWAGSAVAAAKAAGIVGGYEDGSFRPKQQVTRAEMAVIVEKLLAAAQ